MPCEIPLELVVVVRCSGLDQVVDGPFRRETERKTDVAELKVKVDERDSDIATGESHRELRRDEGLARTTLRPEDAHERRHGRVGVSAATPPGQHLLEREMHARC